MRRAAVALGWDVMRLSSWQCPDDFDPDEPALYAEPLFSAAVAEQLGLTVLEPPEDFLTRLPGEYAGREIHYLSAGEARKLGGPLFIKPPNAKTFRAGVFANGSDLPELPDQEMVLTSTPVEWLAEFRYFVRERTVRAWSPYWLNGALARDGDEWIVEPEFAAQTRRLVDTLLADSRIELPAAVVIDAGIIRGFGPAIVEANEASGSGIYGCDPRDVLEVVRAATITRTSESISSESGPT